MSKESNLIAMQQEAAEAIAATGVTPECAKWERAKGRAWLQCLERPPGQEASRQEWRETRVAEELADRIPTCRACPHVQVCRKGRVGEFWVGQETVVSGGRVIFSAWDRLSSELRRSLTQLLRERGLTDADIADALGVQTKRLALDDSAASTLPIAI